jgi:ferrous iron transport protein B
MVFILLYTPCVATVAGLKREFGGKFALRSVITSLLVAYAAATLIFQIGKLVAGAF